MTTLRKAAQQALEFIRWSQFVPCKSGDFPESPSTAPQVEAALRAALDWPDVTITGTYEEFIDFVRMACMHETIYEDSEGRDILVIRVLDAYGMAHSWALEHTRNNLS